MRDRYSCICCSLTQAWAPLSVPGVRVPVITCWLLLLLACCYHCWGGFSYHSGNHQGLYAAVQATEEYLDWYRAKQAEERERKAAEAAAAAAKRAAEGGEGGSGEGAAGEGAEDGEAVVDAAEAAENAAFERVMGIVADRAPVAPKPAAAPVQDAAAAAASDFLSSLRDEARGGADGATRDERCGGWRGAGTGWPGRGWLDEG